MRDSGVQPSKLIELLLRLQEDSEFLSQFNKNPDKVLIEAGILSEEERNTLKSGDIIKIRQLLVKKKT